MRLLQGVGAGEDVSPSARSTETLTYIYIFRVLKMAVYLLITTVWSKPTKISEVYCLGIRN